MGINFGENISFKISSHENYWWMLQLVEFAKINSREMKTFCLWKKQIRKIFSYQNSQAR